MLILKTCTKNLKLTFKNKLETYINTKQLTSIEPNLAQLNWKHANTTLLILNIPIDTVTNHNSIAVDIQSFIQLSHHAPTPCGFAPIEYSAKCQLLGLDVGINGSLSVALSGSGAYHCFLDKYLIQTDDLTVFQGEKSLKLPL